MILYNLQINLYKHAPNTFEPVNLTETSKNLIAFICPDYIDGYTTRDRVSASQQISISDLSNVSVPWLCHLNEDKIQFALETLATFLAEEIYTTLNGSYSNPNVVQCIRRELGSELQSFHEFIRKKAIELHLQKESSYNSQNQELNAIKHQMEYNVIDYLITLSQWFIYICDLFH